ncbi:MAG TPA: DUF2231 domain-containing protein [Solirubrobacteraceae bacterium]|jgi:uncharacterized membrane protein|nr:DUF2231 domain-containing protein [Solirubrobacteraceae bacterium]
MSRQRPGTLLHRAAERAEAAPALDAPGAALAALAGRLPRQGPVKEALSGSWLGHPFHPLSTFVPIGMWWASGLLDATGADEAADRLVEAGVLTALPAATAGLSDWSDLTSRGSRRLGVAHAGSNATATALFAASALARRAGRRRAGRLLALGAHSALTVGGYLGSHLSYVRGIGVSRTTFEERLDDWTAVDGRLVRVVGDHAVGARCTRCGEPLDAGLACPADGSAFRASDGAVVRGPAATPLPVYELRRDGGAVAIRSPRTA